jgi:hypothetical protein
MMRTTIILEGEEDLTPVNRMLTLQRGRSAGRILNEFVSWVERLERVQKAVTDAWI